MTTITRKSAKGLHSYLRLSFQMKPPIFGRNQIRSFVKTRFNWVQWWWAMHYKGQFCRLKLCHRDPIDNCTHTTIWNIRMSRQGLSLILNMQRLLTPMALIWNAAWCRSTLVNLRIVRVNPTLSSANTQAQTCCRWRSKRLSKSSFKPLRFRPWRPAKIKFKNKRSWVNVWLLICRRRMMQKRADTETCDKNYFLILNYFHLCNMSLTSPWPGEL